MSRIFLFFKQHYLSNYAKHYHEQFYHHNSRKILEVNDPSFKDICVGKTRFKRFFCGVLYIFRLLGVLKMLDKLILMKNGKGYTFYIYFG